MEKDRKGIRYLNKHRACTASFTEDEYNSAKITEVIAEMKDSVLFDLAIKGRMGTKPTVRTVKSDYKIDHRYKAWKNNKSKIIPLINVVVSAMGIYVGKRKAIEKYKRGETLDVDRKLGQTFTPSPNETVASQ